MEVYEEKLYGELRRMAGSMMRRERRGHTLQATALVNEAYLQVGSRSGKWENTAHYCGAAARVMRQFLIQYARARRAQRRGGAAQRVTLTDLADHSARDEARDVSAALEELQRWDPVMLRLVELRYVSGYTLEEIASQTGRSLTSVKRDWNFARAWLYRYLTR